MSVKRLEVGIFQDAYGLRAFKRIPGRLLSQRFPKGALTAARAWRSAEGAKAVLKLTPKPDAPAGSFAADVSEYLKGVASMPTIKERTKHLQQWIDAFGADISRHAITSLMVRQQLEAWKAHRKTRPYSASWLNHRRTALMHFYTVMDGKRGRNPAADVPRQAHDEPTPVLYTLIDVQRVLAVMPPSASKTRLAVIAWTGWPHSTVKRITEPDLSKLDQGMARRTRRKKGKGAVGGWVPLLPQAVKALKAFKRDKLYGQFSSSTLRRQWKFYCWKADVPEFTPYQLRHIFGGHAALSTQDERTTSELLQHSDPRQTRRYTEAVVDPKMKAGVLKMSKALKKRRKVTSRAR